MKRRTHLIAALAAMTILATATATAFGYTGQVAGSVTVATQGTVACVAPFTMTATILDAAGAPISGQSVAWSFETSPSASDRFDRTPTTTNASGVATTTVTLANVSGTREIRATAGDISASAVLGPECGGLPNTSTRPAETTGGAPLAGLLLVALLGAVAGTLALRHRDAARG